MTVDPYAYEGTDVLVNHYGIKDEEKLDSIERSLSGFRMWQMLQQEPPDCFDLAYLQRVHEGLFGELYPFAGQFRTVEIRKIEKVLSGRSVEYAMPAEIVGKAEKAVEEMAASVSHDGEASWKKLTGAVAELWKAHPFREGNTRSILLFLHQFARANGFALDAESMSRSPNDIRDALALASTGVGDPLARMLAEACRSDRRRNHPVLGRVSAEAADLLAGMAKVPLRVAAPEDSVRGHVACTSYSIVLVQTAKGIVAVDRGAFEEVPEPGSRVNIDVGTSCFCEPQRRHEAEIDLEKSVFAS